MFPTRFTVGLHRYSRGPDDGYGNPSRVYTPPLDQPGTEYKVCGWADLFLPGSAEQYGNKDRVTENKQLFAPTSFPASPYDYVDCEGEQYEVIGLAADHTHGPWWNPGLKMVQLQKNSG